MTYRDPILSCAREWAASCRTWLTKHAALLELAEEPHDGRSSEFFAGAAEAAARAAHCAERAAHFARMACPSLHRGEHQILTACGEWQSADDDLEAAIETADRMLSVWEAIDRVAIRETRTGRIVFTAGPTGWGREIRSQAAAEGAEA